MNPVTRQHHQIHRYLLKNKLSVHFCCFCWNLTNQNSNNSQFLFFRKHNILVANGAFLIFFILASETLYLKHFLIALFINFNNHRVRIACACIKMLKYTYFTFLYRSCWMILHWGLIQHTTPNHVQCLAMLWGK